MHSIKKNKQKSKSKIIWALLLVILLAFAGYVAYAYYYHHWPFTNTQPEVTEQQKTIANNSDSQNPQTKDSVAVSSKSDNVDTQKTTDEIPVAQNLSVSIDSLKQTDSSVDYKATASQSVKGTCSATFTSDIGKPVVKNSETNDGVCSGSVPILEFDALGTWKLTLRFYTDNTQAIATKDITVN